MKRILTYQFWTALACFCCISPKPVKATAINITSTDGYTVHIVVNLLSLAVPGSCPNGYTYNINYSYSVSFTGSNIPSNLYTLQGNFNCGGTSIFYGLSTTPTSGTVTTTTTNNPYNAATNCATASLNSLGCLNSLQIHINGSGIPDQTNTYVVTAPLPLKLISFNAKAQNESVVLYWTTVDHAKNTVFNLQRSSDGANWQAIKAIPQIQTSDALSQNYQYLDLQPNAGTNYYRLQQIGDDGSSTYSVVLTVKAFSLTNDVTIAPNPATGNDININGLEAPTDWKINVSSATGQKLYASTLTGSNVSIPELSNGLYFLRLTSIRTNQSKVFKFIKN